MKKFIQTVKDIFSIKELRERILTTIGFIVVFRLGAKIMLPGLDYSSVMKAAGNSDGILGLIDNFLGGAFDQKSIFALGIMPYISASIVIQLLTIAVPYFQRLQKEGESGRKRINQITRVLTIAICLVQSFGFLTSIESSWLTIDPALFNVSSVILITSGTMFCMWMGEKITEKGIGNGISMLIMVGIISTFLPALSLDISTKLGLVSDSSAVNLIPLVLEMLGFFLVVLGSVALTQATRRIPISYAKQVAGSKAGISGQRQFLPLKVNAAGVMPIIFAQALMFLPGMLGNLGGESSFGQAVAATFSDPFNWQYNLLFAVLIIVFTFFYTAITINPTQIADDLKRNGGFVPGVKPGPDTAEYIDAILSKITLPGAVFIGLIAVLPAFARAAGVEGEFASFFGGTSLLIMVGVILDTLQQIESYLLMRQYDGLMKNGRIKGRSQDVAIA